MGETRTLGQRLNDHPKSREHPFWVGGMGVHWTGRSIEDDTVGLMLRLICEAIGDNWPAVEFSHSPDGWTVWGGAKGVPRERATAATRVEAMGELLLLLWGEA